MSCAGCHPMDVDSFFWAAGAFSGRCASEEVARPRQPSVPRSLTRLQSLLLSARNSVRCNPSGPSTSAKAITLHALQSACPSSKWPLGPWPSELPHLVL